MAEVWKERREPRGPLSPPQRPHASLPPCRIVRRKAPKGPPPPHRTALIPPPPPCRIVRRKAPKGPPLLPGGGSCWWEEYYLDCDPMTVLMRQLGAPKGRGNGCNSCSVADSGGSGMPVFMADLPLSLQEAVRLCGALLHHVLHDVRPDPMFPHLAHFHTNHTINSCAVIFIHSSDADRPLHGPFPQGPSSP